MTNTGNIKLHVMKKLFLILTFFGLVNSLYADDLTATITNSVIGLNNGAVDLNVAGGTAPYTFSWTGPNGFVSTDEDLSSLEPGEYCVAVSDQYCGIATLCVIVEEDIASALTQEHSLSSVKIFPNPFVKDFSIVLNATESGDYDFRLVDVSGKILFTQSRKISTGVNTIHCLIQESLAAGSYEMMIRDEKGTLVSSTVLHVK